MPTAMPPRSGLRPPTPRALVERALAHVGRGPEMRPLGAFGLRGRVYRRRGPDVRPFPIRWLEDLRRGPRRATDRHSRRAGVRVAAAVAAPVAMGVASLRRQLKLPAAASVAIAAAAPLAAVAATKPRSRMRYVAAGAAYMWFFKVSWELPFDDKEKLRDRLHVDYPIAIDRFLGFGVTPTQRLQRALRRNGEVSLLDKAVVLVYGSWFVPHLLLAYVLMRDERYVPRAAGRLSAAYHLTTPFYWLVPTAPPWWASEHGDRLDGEIDRVVEEVVCNVFGIESSENSEGPGNPWASMPSDHISSAAITAMGLAEVGPVYGAIGWTYVVAAGFAVVYCGEHYLVDVLAGLAVAEIVRVGEPYAAPLVRAVAHALE
ncbi:MAG TPA: phosphatase PAP2 family protein [Solirubrobacteraceae bacterium]|nr:phosphatase PAP2 family protein [Solirubrobacteraceae bacterium]